MSKLIIVDLSGFIYRAFYAIRADLQAPDGTPVNAVSGVFSMLLKLISKYRPSHILLARDSRRASCFRREIYPEYKANRSATPESLVPQFALIESLIEYMQLPNIAIDRFEADDVIGSAVVQWKDQFDEVLIASGDKDLMQFVDDKVKMLDTMKDIIFGRQEVFNKMGVWPKQVEDYLSIVGDSSDNIPGMPGIGAKGAAKILAEHQTLDQCISQRDSFTNKRIKNAFENHVDKALLSKKLVKIAVDLKLDLDFSKLAFSFLVSAKLRSFLQGLGFERALKQLDKFPSAAESELVATTAVATMGKQVNSAAELEDLRGLIRGQKRVAIFSIWEGGKVVSFSLAFDVDNVYSINNSDNFFTSLWPDIFNDRLKEIVVDNSKIYFSFALKSKISLEAKLFDVTIADYLLDTSAQHQLDVIIIRHLGEINTPLDSKRALMLLPLRDQLIAKLEKNNLAEIFYQIDSPCVAILAKMEHQGIYLNSSFLEELGNELTNEVEKIEEKIKEISQGYACNLRSPKQVAFLLFEQLNLPALKKIKTGFSTSSDVLEELVALNISEVPQLLLKYRHLDKLNSTYVQVLPSLVNSETKKIHTNFNQCKTTTGRLASDQPNLQNIPVRTSVGRKIRKAFIAAPGNLLFSADYSQVELRILAHFSQDPTMLGSFHHNLDIHRRTAAEVLAIPLDQVSSLQRSKAKAVNFGLMYGQSSFGLSKTLQITRGEAKEYIISYFERFAKVKSYLDSLKDLCTKKGYAQTLHGRKRFLPEITSSNRVIKAQAERMSVNTPIQGTAADIIKIAMINIEKEMDERKLRAHMLLQVHDELIFEVPEDELELVSELVKRNMESAVELDIPLTVETGYGVNWFDLK